MALDTSVFGLLRAMQEQQTAFTSELKKLLEHGRTGRPTAAAGTTPVKDADTLMTDAAPLPPSEPAPASQPAAAPSEDVEMKDGDDVKEAEAEKPSEGDVADKTEASKKGDKDEAGEKNRKKDKDDKNDKRNQSEKNGKSEKKDAVNGATGQPIISRETFHSILALIHDTYAAKTTPPPAQPQWYTPEQTAFVAELDQLLDDVRALRKPFAAIDEWISQKKRTWLLRRLDNAVGLKALGEQVHGKAGLQLQLADPEVDAAQLLHGLLQKEADKDKVAATAVQNLKAAATVQDRGSIQRDLVFPSSADVSDVPAARDLAAGLVDGRIVDLDQGLKDALRQLNDNSMSAHDDADSRTAKIEKHRKRLAELRRAKAAHEAQKLKRMKPVEVPYFLQEDTPCATCGKASDPQKSPFCIVCFLEVDYCLREMPTVWCSPSCLAETYRRHMASDHPCTAGSRCTSEASKGDEASKVEKGSKGLKGLKGDKNLFCRECVLSFGVSTFYCTQTCASRDFQRHREADHLPKRAMRADYHDDKADLAYKSTNGAGDKRDYTAVDITKHVLSVAEAFASCQKKHPDWDLRETKVPVTVSP